MSSAETQLTLVVPFDQDNQSLKPLLADLSKQHGGQRFSYLQRILSRADRCQNNIKNTDSLLCELLGLDISAGIPYAALSWWADKGSSPDKNILRCDPVHLYPDMEYVLLFDTDDNELDSNEASDLIESLNDFLEVEGWYVEIGSAGRWYLHGNDTGATSFTPIAEVRGQNILPHYPEGELKDKWRKVLTEVQMLLHAHPVNENRESNGLRTINGIWPWGAGETRQGEKTVASVCHGNSLLLKGLAAYQNIDYSPSVNGWQASNNTLVVLPALADYSVDGLNQYLGLLEEEWLTPAVTSLKQGELSGCVIYIGNTACYHLSPKSLRRWWRRKQSLANLLSAS